ncbi:MAG: 4Fe-4S binding protein [Thermoproteota archaeon]
MTVVLCTCCSTLLEKIDFDRLRSVFSSSPLVRRVLITDSLCEENACENLGLRDDGRIVVAACSSRLLEAVFGKPSLVEFVNIREQCAWACESREEATLKAIRLVKGGVQKALRASQPPGVEGLKITREALVIGGGIAGVRCALDIADAGYRVYIVEKEPSIGGVMAQLDKTFPTLDCSICMPGDSEIILHDGTIITLRELVGKLSDVNRTSHRDALLTYSFNSHSLKQCKIISAQKLASPKTLVEVKTSTGAKLRFTRDHKILVDSPGGPIWIECERLKAGDRLYSPRKLKVKASREWIIDLLPEDSFKVADIDLNRIVRNKLREKFTTLRNASSLLNIPYDVLQRTEYFLSVGELKKACEAVGFDWNRVKRKVGALTYQGAGGKIRLKPRFLNEKLMYLLGLVASDGCVEAERIRFYNTNRQLIKLFLKNYKEIFPTRAACLTYLKPESPNQKKRTVVQVKNRILTELAKKLRVKEDLRPVFRLHEKLVAAFLKGFFDGDGYAVLIEKPNWVAAKIGFPLGDEYEYGYGLYLLLKRLGILSKVYEYKGRVIVDISGSEDVLRFVKKVGSSHPEKSLRLRRIATRLRFRKSSGGLFDEMPLECGRLISNLKRRYRIPLRVFPLAHSNMIRVMRQKCRITSKNLNRVLKAVKRIVVRNDPDFIKLQGILKTEFFLDRVEELRIVPSTDDYVYDITVDPTHCFIPKGAFVVSNCIEGPLLSEAGRNKNITIIPNAEVVEVKGRVGDFKVRVRVNPTYVDPDKCNGCGECVNVCPVYQPNKYDADLKPVKAIYCPFAQAVPLKYVINMDYCVECGLCMKACTRAAINLGDEPKNVELNVGAIVVAVGSDLFNPRLKPEYHYGEYENVITNMEFERIICASGPTGGVLLRRDGKPAKRVAFIQCVGSRESGPGIEECSYYCCAASMKEARLILEHDREARVFIFYNELRAFGKGWEDLLYRRCLEEGVVFIRSRPSEIRRAGNGNLQIVYEDTLTGRRGELEVDMVVLALGFKPSGRMVELARRLGVTVDKHGFIQEAHAKMKPLETRVRGVFVAGTCHGPRDIVESAVEGSGAAALVTSLFRRSSLRLPEAAEVSAEKCTGCGRCLSSCEYGAIVREGDKVRVLESVCNGCGACLATCPQEAITLGNWGLEQLAPQVSAMLED